MAYREVDMFEIKEVLQLWLAGRAKKPIARQLRLDPKTVRRYIGVAEACGLSAEQGPEALTEPRLTEVLLALRTAPERPRGESWQRCLERRQRIETLLGQGVRLTKVRKLLRRSGVAIPYATLHRFAVAELGFGRQAHTVALADGEPGKELQLDTGWMGYLEADAHGRRRRFRAWVFTAVVSRMRFVYPCFRETTETAIEACEAAWAFFGGVFGVVLPDNTKAIVTLADPLEPLINSTFLEYAQARGFHIDPARAGHARDKGRVERAVPSTREDCFAGERLHTLEAAREHARAWCMHEWAVRRHSTTRRRPLEHFEAEEKTRLLPPPSAPYDVPLWAEPKVARDHFAQVDRALYSLPTRFIGQRLRARADRFTVRFYQRGVIVKTHPRLAPGQRSTDPSDFPEHKAPYAMRDVDFLRRTAQGHGVAIGRFASALLDGPLPWTRMRRAYALLSLVRKYGPERVEAACLTALEADMLDVRRLQRMLERAEAPQPPPTHRELPPPRYLRAPEHFALIAHTDPQHTDTEPSR